MVKLLEIINPVYIIAVALGALYMISYALAQWRNGVTEADSKLIGALRDRLELIEKTNKELKHELIGAKGELLRIHQKHVYDRSQMHMKIDEVGYDTRHHVEYLANKMGKAVEDGLTKLSIAQGQAISQN